ncbi:membrane protein insertase YidC [Fulvivirgaceae bacterium PWU5]|uniref:Membrane protein insertase YidC n=1 Tax=Dawidia cretensis TaxID=2782350 RepID=A0AAP2GPY4_9BACT|nr:membrane protein insertase YidC [Dawidia cretensis]MBT1708719.1 membrane protein insertase YidC [Dawidia cretensis]
MDRNSAIGLTLIAGLLLAYFYWFAPKPQEAPKVPAATEQRMAATDSSAVVVKGEPEASDSILTATYGDLSAAMKGTDATTTVETGDLRIEFANRGGIIRALELKKFKTYDQKPLLLVQPLSTAFNLSTQYQGREVDLYTLYYQPTQKKEGDTTVLTFTATLSNGASLAHVYKIPDAGHEIQYQVVSKGFDKLLGTDQLTFRWADAIRPLEKDLADTRKNTTVTYNSREEGFDELSAASTGTENEKLATALNWVAIKRKFFLSSIIAKEIPFAGGEVQTAFSAADSSLVKQANIQLTIPKKALADGKASFKFYFGPNDYQVIGKVTENFAENVYLGWRPVYWINKFVIFPVFHFLTLHIGNYGLIIIILVILLKLVLFPLSYRSYLSMAKMKVLKPELDEIKERVGEDMAKVQQEQMKLYGQVGVNPISGCVPVLLQMPILFAMFYLFPASIELRQQPFLWAEDLSTYDSVIQLGFAIPFGVGSHISLFTVIMTLSTLIYTWQNNQMSSVQGPMKSMSYVMPVIFFFFLNSFSAGLTFYYFVSNLVTFAQQAIIKRFVDEDKIRAIMEENKKKNAANGGTGKKSKFMSKLEDAMKAGEEARRKADEEKKKKKS